MSSELSSWYIGSPAVLWVEDPATWSYLRAAWQDPDIGFLVAGGHEAIRAGVKDAREAGGHRNVFGFRDRDFGSTNRHRWLVETDDVDVFVSEVFEVENLLLDIPGLAALGPADNRLRRTESDLRQRATNAAMGSKWWMAVRATINDARDAVTNEFPKHPKWGTAGALTTVAEAQEKLEELLLHSAWGQSISQWTHTLNAAWVAERLAVHAARLDGELNDGSWTRTWSGKEILKQLASHMVTNIDDLAAAMGEHHRITGTTPAEVTDLRSAIRKRAELDPW